MARKPKVIEVKPAWLNPETIHILLSDRTVNVRYSYKPGRLSHKGKKKPTEQIKDSDYLGAYNFVFTINGRYCAEVSVSEKSAANFDYPYQWAAAEGLSFVPENLLGTTPVMGIKVGVGGEGNE
ncbi:hypothetical protein [Phormidium nigroviride]